jgi:hypothetical protein
MKIHESASHQMHSKSLNWQEIVVFLAIMGMVGLSSLIAYFGL